MIFEKEFKELFSDNISGSSAILNHLIELLSIHFKNPVNINEKHINHLIKNISNQFKSFAIIHHFLNEFSSYIQKNNVTRINTFLVDYEEKWKDINKKIAQNFINQINIKNKTVLIHSNSSTIHAVFNEIRKNKLPVNIIQTVSYPAKEGIGQAKILSKLGFKIKLISDSIIGKYIPEIDYALSGADALYKNYFINKAGSLLIALSCQYYKKPIIVVADSRKKSNIKQTEQSQNLNEILKHPVKKIIPENYYFEEIPNKLISKFIYEE